MKEDIFHFLVRFSVLVPVIIGFRNRKHPLWYLVLLSLGMEITSSFSNEYKFNDGFIKYFYNFSWYVEFPIVLYYYYKNLLILPKPALLILFINTFFFTSLMFLDFHSFNSYGFAVNYVVYMVFSFFGFYKMFTTDNYIRLEKSSFFWGNTAFLISSSTSFIIYLFRNYTNEVDMNLSKFIWDYFFVGIMLVFYLLLTIALLQKDELVEVDFRNNKSTLSK